jgi:outer membrane biosynthesis protein TonB
LVLICLLTGPAMAQEADVAPSEEAVAAAEPSGAETAGGEARASEVVDVKWHDVKARKQVKPVVPPFAKLKLPIRCKIAFTVDELGAPVSIDIGECPEAMHDNAKKAARKWRFEPYVFEGEPRRVRFTVVVVIQR